MQGIGGYNGWRWIFIIEGLLTVIAGAIAYFFIPDWPETARFLNDEERAVLMLRLSTDSREGGMNKLNKKALIRIVTDPKIYLGYVPHCKSSNFRLANIELVSSCS